jgi:signal transduction histidine kinase
VQLLHRRHSDPTLREELEQILRDVSRIDGVFQELTLLGGALNLRQQPTNLHRIIDEALANVAAVAEQRGIVIRRHFDPSLPELNVDPDRMYRVYLNLLRNAVQATPDGGAVTVKTQYENRRLAAPEGGRLRSRRAAWVTRVIDTGAGIDEASKTLLFTPMYTTKAQGTGLGLPISLQIVQAHGGVLTLENRADGKGAVATVALPMGA